MVSRRKQVAVWVYLCSTCAHCILHVCACVHMYVHIRLDAELLGHVGIMTGGLPWDGDQYWVYVDDCLGVQFTIFF